MADPRGMGPGGLFFDALLPGRVGSSAAVPRDDEGPPAQHSKATGKGPADAKGGALVARVLVKTFAGGDAQLALVDVVFLEVGGEVLLAAAGCRGHGIGGVQSDNVVNLKRPLG